MIRLPPVLPWLAAAAALPAQVVLAPRLAVARPGQTVAFAAHAGPGPDPPMHWTVGSDDGLPAGTIEGGLYTAPGTDRIRTVRVAAAGPAGAGEATVTLLPAEPFGLLDRVLGPDWLEPYGQDLPFHDLETQGRFPAPGRIVLHQRNLDAEARRTGFGQPLALAWQARPDARGMLLSWREGGEVVRRDVTGRSGTILVPHGRVRQCQVEALVPDRDHPGCYRSLVEPLPVQVRGMMRCSGSALAGPGHADGDAAEARHHEPWGMVRIGPAASPGWRNPMRWVAVADRAGHVVRLVDPDGWTTTLCGRYGHPGHQDSPGRWDRLAGVLFGRPSPDARLRGPTHLAVPRPSPADPAPRNLFVADSGNHVIRSLYLDGRIHTVAGQPGVAGHRDASRPGEARFDDPRGLACDGAGRIYVADRGNRVLRVIEPGGPVTTLAGTPGQTGTQDGPGGQARFSDLKALVYAPGFRAGRTLLVLDGHGVRAVDPDSGAVTTILGRVAEPGYQDVLRVDRGDRVRALLEPCLRDPADLLWLDGLLYLADAGNHAVRCLHPGEAALHTVAGDPGTAEVRWGLLRDGMPAPLTPAHAALAAPRALAEGWDDHASPLVVATGSCLAVADDTARRGERKRIVLGDLDGMVRNRPFLLGGGIEGSQDPGGGAPGRLTVEFWEADGTLGRRIERPIRPGEATTVPGEFTQSGRAAVAAYYLSPGGVSAGIRAEVTVSPGP